MVVQVEEMFDAASRYLLFPLKRAVADALLPRLEMASPAELCHWLILSDMYDALSTFSYILINCLSISISISLVYLFLCRYCHTYIIFKKNVFL